MKALFWAVAALILWHYAGYGFFIALLARIKKSSTPADPRFWPKVSIIISAYNEQRVITRRIENCLALDYPKNCLEVIVGSDGSNDETVKCVRSFGDEHVRVLDFEHNRGRSQVHNDCVKEAIGEIIFFTDADTQYEPNCITKMIRHYADPRVGSVGGELKWCNGGDEALRGGQGIYWKWEYALRRWQSRLGVLTKVSGANMSMRKTLYHPLPEDVDIDQAVGPIVVMQGHRVIHEPEAIAYEELPRNLPGELTARRRFTLRALTALSRYRGALNPLKHPWLCFHLLSYRVLRYLMPLLLLGVFVTNGLLVRENHFFVTAFVLQAVFYLLAVIGYPLAVAGKTWRVFSWPFSFVLFQLGILVGDFEFLMGRRLRAYCPEG